MNLGKAIKLCRSQKEFSQKILAEKAEISVSYLSLIEQGKRDPNFSIVEKIAESLQIPLSILIFLAADENEINDLGKETTEKLSNLALSLIRATTNEKETSI